MPSASRHSQRIWEDCTAGDDAGKLQDRQFTAGEGGGPQRARQARHRARARRRSHRLPGHSAGSGGVRRLGKPPGSERRLADPHRHPGRPQGRGGVPGAALRPETRQQERADGGGRGPGLPGPRHDGLALLPRAPLDVAPLGFNPGDLNSSLCKSFVLVCFITSCSGLIRVTGHLVSAASLRWMDGYVIGSSPPSITITPFAQCSLSTLRLFPCELGVHICQWFPRCFVIIAFFTLYQMLKCYLYK